MPRIPQVRWHDKAGCYRSDVGEHYTDPKGRQRRKTVYFQGFAKSDKRGAQESLDAYLRARDDRTVSNGEATLADLVQLYLGWSERNAAPLTYLGHQKMFHRLLKKHPCEKGSPARSWHGLTDVLC